MVVCGNEKGGSGKSTMAVHIAIALMGQGHRVATVDLDSRQLTLTRYLENRKAHIARHECGLRVPRHIRMDGSTLTNRDEAEHQECKELTAALTMLREQHDFIVVDTPGFDTNLSRTAHSLADTLVTPMNDSFIDYDVLARVDPDTGDVTAQSQYALQVREARRARSGIDDRLLDWVLVRNRLSSIASRNEKRVHESLRLLGVELGFRLIDGVAERVVYRELFAHGLTVMDDPLSHLPNMSVRNSNASAKADIERLIENLNLPVDGKRDEREKARQAWLERFRQPRSSPDIFAD